MALRIGIPLFNDEVSPRFCFAERMLVVRLGEGGEELDRDTVGLGSTWFPDRLALLAARGIDVLVCGGFNAAFLPHAERMGIRVISGVSGPAEESLSAFREGRLSANPQCCRGPGGGRGRRGRGSP